jgi:hypothetical protein
MGDKKNDSSQTINDDTGRHRGGSQGAGGGIGSSGSDSNKGKK